ncbi:hypothetical protein NQ318_008857 [Aromia moschata]|uniref:Uncharacterized protein n=1 Tax=Aromia moschata TaxID=1265417 RepID=A0AAV8ZAD7_9CUCU|nr:hypothetical protein NQ318_008857 [Aromia moschata]
MKLHPYYRQVPIKDMQDSYDYLTKHKFQNHNIFKVMHVLLYPVEKLDKALNEMRTNEDFNYISLSQVKKLRLMLYFIEKEHHFTGNGIWRKYSTDLSDKTNE